MPTITKKQLAVYEQLKIDRDNGRLLTPDGLRLICEASGYDPEKIGKHFLKVLPQHRKVETKGFIIKVRENQRGKRSRIYPAECSGNLCG